jgi:hypothetical protein
MEASKSLGLPALLSIWSMYNCCEGHRFVGIRSITHGLRITNGDRQLLVKAWVASRVPAHASGILGIHSRRTF